MTVDIVFWSVVTARFALPLLIPKYPLPGVVACLVLDAVDQTIFQAFGFNPPFYQSYDKAMDVFYLSSPTWPACGTGTNMSAFGIDRFLFFYRQIGVVAFELTRRARGCCWCSRTRSSTSSSPTKRSAPGGTRCGYEFKFWVMVAAAIWIFIKLPQEYWIHIAELDLTDTIRDVPWFGPAARRRHPRTDPRSLVFVVRPRLPQADWSLRLAADPLPAAIADASERAAWQARHRKVFDEAALEKILLIGLISVIYGRVLPGVEASSLQIFLGVAVFAIINAALGLWAAKRGHSWQSAGVSFLVVFVVNIGLVAVAALLLRRGEGGLRLVDTLFFVFLFSILTMLYDRYRPIHDYRVEAARAETAARPSPA